MIKSALIIVPHQDDELNIAGFILEDFINNNIRTYILYVTKGNYYKDKYVQRQRERDKVLNLFGNIEIIQLEYDDNYNSNNHIFNDKNKRKMIKEDMKKCIVEKMCELIICVDYDRHADHRMVSSLFDEILCEAITEFKYRPIVLKKMAYLGVWDGENDYFEKTPQPTKPILVNVNTDEYENVLPNEWNDRIRIKTKEKDYGLKFWKSKVYKAYCTYFTQCGFVHFWTAANADVTYWYRNTNNLCMRATVEVSSGNAVFINDFCIANIEGITTDFEGESRFLNSAWVPEKWDGEKKVRISFNEPQVIKVIKLYQNFMRLGHIKEMLIAFSNGMEQYIFNSDRDVEYLSFEVQKNIKWIEISLISVVGNAGIRELEIYSDNGEFPWNIVPFEKYESTEVERKGTKWYKFLAWVAWVEKRAQNKLKKKLGLPSWG